MTDIKRKALEGEKFLEIVIWYNAKYGTNHFAELFGDLEK